MAVNKYLLDTHALIWFQEDNPKLPKQVLEIIQNTDNTILFSQISLFEIAIKQTLGKLPSFYATVEEIYMQAIKDSFTFGTIQNFHIYEYNQVKLMEQHRDPFDRLLIATAIHENAIILSNDDKFNLYQNTLRVLWN